jgi:ketosteroid isomerase-like protein
MSENLELVRSIFESWERGDFGSAAWADSEIEYVIDGPWPIGDTGLAGMATTEREFLSAFENFSMAAQQYRELDDGRVLVLHRPSGRAKTSGLDLAQVTPRGGACLFHIRKGKVTRFVGYFDRDRALADLGLEE